MLQPSVHKNAPGSPVLKLIVDRGHIGNDELTLTSSEFGWGKKHWPFVSSQKATGVAAWMDTYSA